MMTSSRHKDREQLVRLAPEWVRAAHALFASRLGRATNPLIVVLIVLTILVPFLWANGERIAGWSISASTADRLAEPILPTAKPDELTLLVANINGDTNGDYEKLLLASLRDQSFISVRRVRRSIDASGNDVTLAKARAEAQAQALLRRTRAQILLWGEVLRGNGATLKLYWSVSANNLRQSKTGYYRPRDDNALPRAFHADLQGAVQTSVSNDARTISDVEGILEGASLNAYVDRTNKLIRSVDQLRDVRLSASLRASMAPILVLYGRLRRDELWVSQGLNAFRKAIQEFHSAKEPVNAAMTEIRFVRMLLPMGSEARDASMLDESVRISRDALSDVGRDVAPLVWARASAALGAALSESGYLSRSRPLLEEAVSAFRDALDQGAEDMSFHERGQAQRELGQALIRLADLSGGTEAYERADQLYLAMLSEVAPQHPGLIGVYQHERANALAKWALREMNPARIRAAIAAYREAAAPFAGDDRDLYAQSFVEGEIGELLLEFGKRERNAGFIKESVTAYQRAVRLLAIGEKEQSWLHESYVRATRALRDAEEALWGALAE